MKNFKQRLNEGELLVGSLVSIAAHQVAEIMAAAGFDWLFIDGEHAPLSDADMQNLIQAASPLPCLVRVHSLDEIAIKKALDSGAAGIIVPQINTAEQAALAVNYAKYPPQGQRGVGISRAQGYGFSFSEYIEQANDKVLVVVQAEHALAVDNIEAIAATAGVDPVFIGPYDLSASLGKTGQLTDPQVLTAVERIELACTANGLKLGVFGTSAETVKPYIDKGFTLITAGTDTLFLGQGARDMLAQLKE
ncbi:MAG: 2,4-dihydroxyhept-2-ene-1,7-dioic acid aldolase [Gammaproteobacteria bacterium]|nr:2,4-dihydroxyhept-2-ene-1,7-dioic acid aldolase [Gammaproteobacteria bacterium]MBQ0838541.1 2,4-dihydroxyhept-2-ene-1,7-dioic acid aldolase [Gammaproteobacteria bacterium]